ncbi:DUF4158 domain-containing protein [Streptomyces sp. NPDC000880]
MRRMASVERTAYPRFKRTVSSRELHESFTPGPSEVAWARGKARSAEHVLALVVLLKSYQKLGYFPDLAEVGVPVRTVSPAANGGDQSFDLEGRVSSAVLVDSASARRPPFSSGTSCRWCCGRLRGASRSR